MHQVLAVYLGLGRYVDPTAILTGIFDDSGSLDTTVMILYSKMVYVCAAVHM